MTTRTENTLTPAGSTTPGSTLRPGLVNSFVMAFIFLLLFGLPAIFSPDHGPEGWDKVFKIWKDRSLLIPLFLLNHFLLIPKLVLRKRYVLYSFLTLLSITLIAGVYYFIDQPGGPSSPMVSDKHPGPVPPYAELLLFSLLIVAVDTGLSLSAAGLQEEERRSRLEKENAEARLAMLQHQISPHFFMNTLNNIYTLIELDKDRSRESVMRLSRIMRYLLDREGDGFISIEKEFEFVRSYVELMKLRFTESVTINLSIPEETPDRKVPVLLFITFLENAFKFGVSSRHASLIDIGFRFMDGRILFQCSNPKHSDRSVPRGTGIGLENTKKRLDLIYGDRYVLEIKETDLRYDVELELPLHA